MPSTRAGEILELDAATTRALARWRDQWAEAAAKRERTVEERFGEFFRAGEDEEAS